MNLTASHRLSVAARAQSELNSATVVGVGTASAPYQWPQQRTREVLAQHFDQYRRPAVKRMFARSGIETRQFVIHERDFRPQASAAQMHQLFSETAPPLALRAAREALESAQTKPEEIGLVVVATCTGYLCPGLSAHLAHDLGLSDRVQRADLVGMGCAGAMPALQRSFDYVRCLPERKALMVAVEVCSSCCFVDETTETVVGNVICGDGAAALVLQGGPVQGQAGSPNPQILSFESVVKTEWMSAVGLENRHGKHRIVLSKELRHAAGPAVAEVVQRLLEKHRLSQEDIDHWVFHAGGAAVLANIEQTLGFGDKELESTYAVFRKHGNMSSPTTLFVLDHIHRHKQPRSGELGIALALGPGLATEAALLRWQ